MNEPTETKFEQFVELPEDIQRIIMNMNLETADEKIQSTAVCSNKDFYALFQPNRLISKLLLCVAIGDQSGAKKLLEFCPELLLERGNVTDYSGRTFINITAFEYVLWALDTRYMGKMILDCLPCTSQGEEIKQGLQEQYNNVKNKKVHYTLDGKDFLENHFDYSPFLQALEEYANNCEDWNYPMKKDYWSVKVGVAQCGLPAHMRQHYCDPDRKFEPEYTSNKETFNRSLEVSFDEKNCNVMWSPSGLPDLGINYGIVRGPTPVARPMAPPFKDWVLHDFEVFTALCDMRIKDFDALHERLQKPLQKPDLKLG